MLALHELQQRVYRAIVLADDAGFESEVADGRVPAAARIRIYRNNLHATARMTLAAMYPVVAQLVGEPCFVSLARGYTARFPSRSGDLALYGRRFPEFLGELYGSGGLEYLGGVASLELACVESRLAPNAGVLDPEALRRVPEDALAELRFSLHPSTQLSSSPFPVYTIWRAHDTGDFASVDLSAAGERVLVFRDHDGVVVERIDAATLAFIECLGKGGTLAAAVTAATGACRDFDAASSLRRLHERGLLSRYAIDVD